MGKTAKSNKSDTLKKEVLERLEDSLGIVTMACKNVGISRKTFYEWKKNDEEFAKAVKDIQEVTLDFVESQLHKQIKDGNVSAAIFYLKTKGKERGYIEQQNIEINERKPLSWFTEVNRTKVQE